MSTIREQKLWNDNEWLVKNYAKHSQRTLAIMAECSVYTINRGLQRCRELGLLDSQADTGQKTSLRMLEVWPSRSMANMVCFRHRRNDDDVAPTMCVNSRTWEKWYTRMIAKYGEPVATQKHIGEGSGQPISRLIFDTQKRFYVHRRGPYESY